MDWIETAAAAGIWRAVEDELSQAAAVVAAVRCLKSCAGTAGSEDDNCWVVEESLDCAGEENAIEMTPTM